MTVNVDNLAVIVDKIAVIVDTLVFNADKLAVIVDKLAVNADKLAVILLRRSSVPSHSSLSPYDNPKSEEYPDIHQGEISTREGYPGSTPSTTPPWIHLSLPTSCCTSLLHRVLIASYRAQREEALGSKVINSPGGTVFNTRDSKDCYKGAGVSLPELYSVNARVSKDRIDSGQPPL